MHRDYTVNIVICSLVLIRGMDKMKVIGVIAGIVLLASVYGAAVAAGHINSAKSTSNSDDEAYSKALQSGSTYTYQLDEVNAYEGGGNPKTFVVPDSGKIFVRAQIKWENHSSYYYISKMSDPLFKLYDGEVGCTLKNCDTVYVFGKETKDLTMIFEVPSDHGKLRLKLDIANAATRTKDYTTLQETILIQPGVSWNAKVCGTMDQFDRCDSPSVIEHADPGKVFVETTVIVKNLSYGGGDLKPLTSGMFKLKGSNGTFYSSDAYESQIYRECNMNLGVVILGPSVSYEFKPVFIIPDDVTPVEVVYCIYDGGYLPAKDANLHFTM